MQSSSSSSSAANSSSCSAFHVDQLAKLCRICARVLTGYSYFVKDHVSKLNDTFQIKCEDDEQYIHPSKFCNTCYLTVQNCTKRGCKANVEVFTWTVHNENN